MNLKASKNSSFDEKKALTTHSTTPEAPSSHLCLPRREELADDEPDRELQVLDVEPLYEVRYQGHHRALGAGGLKLLA